MNSEKSMTSLKGWQNIIAQYNKPVKSKSIWQLVNSIVPYVMLWVAMIFLIDISYWLVLPLSIVAAGFLIRIFIIFHDCGHGSFFKSKKWNRRVGTACGILAFTPYDRWTDNHRYHHKTVGNLDKRGLGDVWTLTTDEYKAMTSWEKFKYRTFRNPIIMLLIGGPLMFAVAQRFTSKSMTKKQKQNIYITNVVLAVAIALMSWLIGFGTFMLIQIPVMYFSAIGGVYLFYLQHQYDDVIWTRTADWDYLTLALHGSSFFKLPLLLRWFTGNIGYHHVHHLGPTIPNYNLVKCHNENPLFHEVPEITFFKSFHSLKLRLWDEKTQQIVSFRQLKTLAVKGE